jgi:hypothetical protein
MKVIIASRYKPFSHLPGAACLVPGQEAIIQAFPSFSEVRTLKGELIFTEPGRKTLVQDLEKPFRSERLSFGSHKQQDVDAIRRRGDLKEILPLWHKLATYYPSKGEVLPGSLLYELCHETDRNRMEERFLNVYYAGFSPFFIPRKKDSEHHGFALPPLGDEDPLLLITEGAKAIRSMIVQEQEHEVRLLPKLPSLFSCGRWVDCPIASGVISIEWTKHFLRRVIYTPFETKEIELKFPKEVKQYRVKAFGKSFLFDNFRG